MIHITGNTPQGFEAIVIVSVLAEDSERAATAVAEERWLNYQDEDGEQFGKIVYLFPQQRLVRMTGHGPIGYPIPHVRTEGEAFETFTLRAYLVALRLTLIAPNLTEAANFVTNRSWFNPGEGIDVLIASAPTRLGGFEAVVSMPLHN